MKKRALSFFLLLTMLFSLAACGGGTSTGETTADTASGTDTAPTGSDDEYSLGNFIPKQDLGGYTYTILTFKESAIKSLFVEEESGSLIDDAVAAKIRAVEEHLNCDIVLSDMCDPQDITGDTETSTSILSGEHEFDIVMAHDISLANMSLEGMFVNVLELESFDFDGAWWPSKTIDTMRVGDTMFLMSNNISYYPVSDLRAMFFNKKLAEDYQLGSLYEKVYDGTWTMDVFNKIVADGFKDLNGNTEKDPTDRYGFVNMPWFYGWLEAFNMGYFSADKNGEISYNFDMQKNTQIVETLYDLLFTSGGSYITDESNTFYVDMFAEGQSLFCYTRLDDAVKNLSFSDTQYGILPMPKLDENQEDYYGGCTDKPSAIPVTVPEESRETVALITEALNIEGYHTVFPVYYETALKVRYSDETDDARMIDLMHDNRILSFSYLYGGFEGPALKLLETLLDPAHPSTDVASFADSVKTLQQDRVNALNEGFSGE